MRSEGQVELQLQQFYRQEFKAGNTSKCDKKATWKHSSKKTCG